MRVLMRDLRRYVPAGLAVCAGIPALYTLSRMNYLLFHSLAELLSVVVAFGTFTVAWNTRRTLANGYLMLLGIAMLFVGALDLVHTLAFRGMGVFPATGADPPTQLWIAARGLESLSLLAAPLLVARRIPAGRVVAGYGLVTAGLLAAIFTGRFPACYVEGSGLTACKIGAEYAIIGVLLAALALLWRIRRRFDREVFAALALSLVLTAGAEASFTLYRDVAGFFNIVGHILKVAAFLLIYRAIVVTGLVQPLDFLSGSLRIHEEALREENRKLAALTHELEEKNAALAGLVAEKNELLGIAAHDIRSPLSVIELYSAFLREKMADGVDGEQLKFIDTIRATNRKVLALVNNLLDLSAIEAGRLRLDVRPVRLEPVVEETLELHRALAKAKGIEIRFAPHGDLPEVPADPLRVEQVLGNLLSNAVKFSPPNSVVTVRMERRDGEVALAVQDEGPGIPPDQLPRIFAPFTGSGARGNSVDRSTGLGLAIVRKIADSHGGRIDVESAVGKGSTFTFLLPLEREEPAAGAAPDGESGRGERI